MIKLRIFLLKLEMHIRIKLIELRIWLSDLKL